MPKVSLIIPVYNVSKYLKRCIDSIASQTFTDFEAIFVNDGSTDNSELLCKTLIADYPNMRMVTKKNGGLSSARLYGFNEAEGQYIAFIDSDDYLEPKYIESLYNGIIQNSADMSICCYFLDNDSHKSVRALSYDDNRRTIEKQDVFDDYILPQLPDVYGKSRFIPSFMWLRMFKRELINEELFVSERDVYQEDLVFGVRSFRSIRRIAIVNVPLYNYCINQGSLTMKYRENVWGMMTNLHDEILHNTRAFMCDELKFRLTGLILCAVHFALYNASYLNYKSFKCLFNELIKKSEVKATLKYLSWFKLKRSYVIMVFMIISRQSFLLYKFNQHKI